MSFIDRVAAKVHDSWVKVQYSRGVRSRKTESGDEQMVPWEELSESAKDLDRAGVIAMIEAIHEEDMEIVPAHYPFCTLD